MPRDPTIEIRGRSVFEWLDGGTFLVLRWSIEPDEFPNGIAILGPDAMHYFDSRGVARVYEMSLRDGVWKLYRPSPDWSQRFIGELGEDGRTIAGRWERCDDGSTWELDFHLTYTKVESQV